GQVRPSGAVAQGHHLAGKLAQAGRVVQFLAGVADGGSKPSTTARFSLRRHARLVPGRGCVTRDVQSAPASSGGRFARFFGGIRTLRAPTGLRVALCLVLVVAVGIGTLWRIRALSRWQASRGELVLALGDVETVAERNSSLQWSTIGGGVDLGHAETEMGQLRGEFDRYVRVVLALEEDHGTGAATLRTAF